jgi:hypothetical protein
LAKTCAAADVMTNVEVTVYPGVPYGYTAPSNAQSWNEAAATNRRASAMAVLDTQR